MLARLVYPLCLLVGALLAVVAGVLHPDLAGDGAAQLTTIAQCAGWRAIHWTFLFSFPLALTGLVGLARVHAGNPGESAVRAGLILGTFAYGAWTVTVAFMTRMTEPAVGYGRGVAVLGAGMTIPLTVSPATRFAVNAPCVDVPVVVSVPADAPFTVRCTAPAANPVMV